MKLTKEEQDHITIWRLLKKISVKYNEGYYSLEISVNQINKKYYLPSKSHCNFDTPQETIQSLKNLLKLSQIEYKYDVVQIAEKIAATKNKKRKLYKELQTLEKEYNKAIKALKK